MSFFNNEKHFLHQHLTYLESIGMEGRDGRFVQFLADKGIPTTGICWAVDHSTIDWNRHDSHFQFWYDHIGCKAEIQAWLSQSELKNHEFLFTWLAWEDPIIKVKAVDFINNWEEFNCANGRQGLILTTEDGSLYLEFTDDWKYHLNSNFEIKPGSKTK